MTDILARTELIRWATLPKWRQAKYSCGVYTYHPEVTGPVVTIIETVNKTMSATRIDKPAVTKHVIHDNERMLEFTYVLVHKVDSDTVWGFHDETFTETEFQLLARLGFPQVGITYVDLVGMIDAAERYNVDLTDIDKVRIVYRLDQ